MLDNKEGIFIRIFLSMSRLFGQERENTFVNIVFDLAVQENKTKYKESIRNDFSLFWLCQA